jgi:hypothetical protein
MDTQYIVLDGTSAELTDDGYTLSWSLGDYMYKDLRSDEHINVQLHGVQFIGEGVALATIIVPMNSVEIYANMNLRNLSQTQNYENTMLVGLVDATYNTSNYVVTSSTSLCGGPTFTTDKFNNITIYCKHNMTALDFNENETTGVNKAMCKFILKLTKLKK